MSFAKRVHELSQGDIVASSFQIFAGQLFRFCAAIWHQHTVHYIIALLYWAGPLLHERFSLLLKGIRPRMESSHQISRVWIAVTSTGESEKPSLHAWRGEIENMPWTVFKTCRGSVPKVPSSLAHFQAKLSSEHEHIWKAVPQVTMLQYAATLSIEPCGCTLLASLCQRC